MKFYQPSEVLKNFVIKMGISETPGGCSYTVFPQGGVVIGFQFKGYLHRMIGAQACRLSISGVSGISDTCSLFTTDIPTGSVLVYFTPAGFSRFTNLPLKEFFDRQISLREVFPGLVVDEVEDKLRQSQSDSGRIGLVEEFLISQFSDQKKDFQIEHAIRLINQSKGMIRMDSLAREVNISISPLEKRFRNLIGTSPKKFASIIRMQSIVADLQKSGRTWETGFEHGFFDQSHYIKAFIKFTGTTPTQFTERK